MSRLLTYSILQIIAKPFTCIHKYLPSTQMDFQTIASHFSSFPFLRLKIGYTAINIFCENLPPKIICWQTHKNPITPILCSAHCAKTALPLFGKVLASYEVSNCCCPDFRFLFLTISLCWGWGNFCEQLHFFNMMILIAQQH